MYKFLKKDNSDFELTKDLDEYKEGIISINKLINKGPVELIEKVKLMDKDFLDSINQNPFFKKMQ